MVRSLVVGFGAVTMLAAAGSMTPTGQVILGMKPTATAQATPAAVMQDRPAPVPAHAQSVVAGLVAPATSAKRMVPAKPSPRVRPQARRAAAARRLQAAPAPLGQSFDISQLLPLLQSQFLPLLQSQPMTNVSPAVGMMSRNPSLPDILQQLTNPVLAPASAPAPQPIQAPTPVVPAQPQPGQAGYSTTQDTISDSKN
jgi:hypothetical protein